MTSGSDAKPTTRTMNTLADGKLVIEIKDRVLVIRPFRSRKGGPAEVTVNIGNVYQRALMARVEPL